MKISIKDTQMERIEHQPIRITESTEIDTEAMLIGPPTVEEQRQNRKINVPMWVLHEFPRQLRFLPFLASKR